MKYSELTGEWFFKIFPTIRVRYSSTGFFIEKYQPRNNDYAPIKFYDESNINDMHIEEIRQLMLFMKEIDKRDVSKIMRVINNE